MVADIFETVTRDALGQAFIYDFRRNERLKRDPTRRATDFTDEDRRQKSEELRTPNAELGAVRAER
jgi:hypothetical protein